MPNRDLTYELFAGLEKATFGVLVDEQTRVEMELAAVVVLRQGKTSAGTSQREPESFSLTFHGPGERLLPQRTYIFEHATIGRFDLFIVPLGREGGMIQYQAIFNRLPKAD